MFLGLLMGIAAIALGLFLFLFATWLFFARIRAGECLAKSFKMSP